MRRAAAPGNWTWTRDRQGSVATFGVAGQDPTFVARCDTSRRTVTLSIPATAGAGLAIDTSDGTRSFSAAAIGTVPPRTGATLAATDGFLDRIAFSRGRFRVRPGSGPAIVIPAWAEFARTVEDCRP